MMTKRLPAVIAAALAALTALASVSCAGGADPTVLPPNGSEGSTATAISQSETPSSATGMSTGTPEDPPSTETPDLTPTPVGTPTPTGTPTPETIVIDCPEDALRALSPLFVGDPDTAQPARTVNVNEKRRTIDGQKIQIVNVSLTLNETALVAFEELNFDFGRAYPSYSLLLVACCTDASDDLRCSRTDALLRAHKTGYAVDLWYMTKKDGKNVSIQPFESSAAEKTAFLKSAAAKRGIIVAKGKQEDARHWRFVGLPHSLYIEKADISLEDYLDLLGNYTCASPLTIEDAGLRYRVYAVAAQPGVTKVEVPAGSSYHIQSAGSFFVVTLTEEGAPEPPTTETPTETPTVPPTETQTPVPSETPTPDPSQGGNGVTVYLDAGHGFLSRSGVMDYGAGEGSFYYTLSQEKLGHGQYEADLDLQIALKVEKLLKDRGYTVIMSRSDYAMERLPISDRAARAKNAGADLLISIHANSAENPDANGARVYYNASESFPKRQESLKLAQAVCDRINELCPSPTAAYPVDGHSLAMLNGTGPIPSILVETCFMTNRADAEKALDEDWQNRMAKAIADGIG